jgi:hypothetical protein
VIGAILCLLALFVAGPIALFFAGALWSAVYGWLFSATAVDAAGNDAGSTG